MSNESKNLLIAKPNPRTTTKSWSHCMAAVTLIAGLFVLGAACAISHHIFYHILHRSPTTNQNHQRWVTRIGMGLAFLFRASLAASVGIARQQILWDARWRIGLKEKSIDAMFGAASDPLSFLKLDMLCNAKLATLMALVIWILPLSAIVTPSTIIVVSTNHTQNLPCLVRTISFEFDTMPTEKLNTTNPNITSFALADYIGAKYQQPSMMARQIFTISSFSDHIASPNYTGLDSIAENTAQWLRPLTDTNVSRIGGHNCSYTVKFSGPTLRCTEMPPNTSVPWASQYTNDTVYDAGVWGDVILWVRYVASTTVDWSNKTVVDSLPQSTCSCVNSISNYTVRLDVVGGRFQEPTIMDVEILNPALSAADLDQKVYEPNRVLFETVISILGGNVVEGNEIYSSDGFMSTVRSRDDEDSGYKSLPNVTPKGAPNGLRRRATSAATSAAALQSAVHAEINKLAHVTYEHGKLVNQTEVGATPLASASYEIVPEIGFAIERMVQKMIVSLLAADSSGIERSRPLMEYAALTTTTCNLTTPGNIYQYSPHLLVASYAPAVAIALLMAAIGLEAIYYNGEARDTKFSTIARMANEKLP